MIIYGYATEGIIVKIDGRYDIYDRSLDTWYFGVYLVSNVDDIVMPFEFWDSMIEFTVDEDHSFRRSKIYDVKPQDL